MSTDMRIDLDRLHPIMRQALTEWAEQRPIRGYVLSHTQTAGVIVFDEADNRSIGNVELLPAGRGVPMWHAFMHNVRTSIHDDLDDAIRTMIATWEDAAA